MPTCCITHVYVKGESDEKLKKARDEGTSDFIAEYVQRVVIIDTRHDGNSAAIDNSHHSGNSDNSAAIDNGTTGPPPPSSSSSRRFGGGGGGSSLVFSEFETEEDNAYNCEGGGVGEGGESPVGPVTNEVWNY